MIPPFINLYDKNTPLGKFALPSIIEGINGGKFKLEYAIIKAVGGNGVLFSAQKQNRSLFDKQEIAIKISKQQDIARIDRFKNEVRIISELRHANIARYFDNGVVIVENENGKYEVPWIAMERCGKNLEKYIEREGVLPVNIVIRIGIQMCEALEYFHSKDFVHRDIKPSNFVFGKNNEKSKIKMIDFGIGKKVRENVAGRPFDSLTKPQEAVGPFMWMSSELIAYSQDETKTYPVDHLSDLFQLGKVLWYLATGKVTAGVPSKRDCSILHSLVLNLIQDEPDDRIQNAKGVKDVLLSILEESQENTLLT